MGLRTSVGEGGDLQCRTVSALINRVVNIGKQELCFLVIFLKELEVKGDFHFLTF
jgi:hypothetical protein